MKRNIMILMSLIFMVGFAKPTQAQGGAITRVKVDYYNSMAKQIAPSKIYTIKEGETVIISAPEIEGHFIRNERDMQHEITGGTTTCQKTLAFLYTMKNPPVVDKEKEEAEEKAKEEEKIKAEEQIKENERLKEDAEIKQKAEEKDARLSQFVDLKKTEWFIDDLDKAVQLGIINGIPKNETEVEFRPNDTLSHAQLYTMIANIVSEKLEESPTLQGDAKWYTESLTVLQYLGVVSFKFNEDMIHEGITRLETVECLTKAALLYGKSGVDISGKFTDTTKITKRLLDIVQGYPDGTYGTDDILTRAQSVALINRTLEKIEK